jgi:UDP-N-acetylmuramyl tripeptide synthase
VLGARDQLAGHLGRTIARLSRLLRLGSGTTVGGRVTLAVAPDFLSTAARGRRIALVSGTNGKTTTRTLLTAALRTQGPVVSNAGGANLPGGLAAALAADQRSGTGVLEVDEPYLPRVAVATGADLVVLLNLSRDQLDRYAEVRRVAAGWRDSLLARPRPVVANADDPLVVWAAAGSPDPVWVAAGANWRQDAAACPACGGLLSYASDGWASACGFVRPAPAWTVGAGQVHGPDGRSHPVQLRLPGRFNLGNAALAAAAADRFGVPAEVALPAMTEVTEVEGRYACRDVDGRAVRLLLAKNPAGWQEALSVVAPPPASVVVAVNARPADGRDPAWLWDVPFEQLAGRTVWATGERARDVAVRLRYADVAHVRVDEPVRAVLAAPPGPVEVLANYTAFQRLWRVLRSG